MHPAPDPGHVSWPLRVMRPWVVASLGGIIIGGVLLLLDGAGKRASDFTAGYYLETESRLAAPADGAADMTIFGVDSSWNAPNGGGAPTVAEGDFSPAPPVSVDEAR